MPGALIGAVLAGALGAVGVAAGAGFAIAGATFWGLTGWAAIGASFAVGMIGSLIMSGAQMLLGKDAGSREVPFAAEASARTQLVRSAIASRKIICGDVVASGALVFAASYGTAGGQVVGPGSGTTGNRDYLAMVVVLAGHQSQAILEVLLDDKASDDPIFSGLVTIKKHLGAADQSADDDLIAANLGWTTNHRLRGLTYVIALLKWDADAFPSGIPNVKARILGLGPDMVDPRSAATGWTDNAAVLIDRYLVEPDWGLNASQADEIHAASFIASANICDEIVETPQVKRTVTANATTGELAIAGEAISIRTGDRVEIISTGTVPAGLTAATPYYAIVTRSIPTQSIKLALSLAKARAFDAITFGDAGTGTIEVYRTGQPRYTLNGVIDCARPPADILDDMMSSDAGIIVYQQGQYRHFAGASSTPVATLDESTLRGPLGQQPRRPKRELANAIRGTFIDPAKDWQPADFPAHVNPTYRAQDADEEIFRDIKLPFTTDAVMAQRLAKITLEAIRQGASLRWPAKMGAALKLCVWDVVYVNVAWLGYVNKQFRVTSWALTQDGGIDLELREHAAGIFDWNAGEATTIDLAPDTSLPDPRFVPQMAITSITETLAETRTGAGVACIVTVHWQAAADAFIAGYQVEYRKYGDATWLPTNQTEETERSITDIVGGSNYEFRLRAINRAGVKGAWSPIRLYFVLGLAQAPADVTGFSITPLHGQALARWDRHPDADVRIGGRIHIRHSPLKTGATWANAMPIPGGECAGVATEASLPLRDGTYIARAEDSSENFSETDVAVVIQNLTSLISMDVVATITEDPTFSGAKTRVVAVDSLLRLDGGDLMDDWGDVDDRADWDYATGVALNGTYAFASTLDLGAVYVSRAVLQLEASVLNIHDTIDARVAPIDEWPDFDGAIQGSPAKAWVEVRTTEDDPSGSPAWTAWAPFLAGTYTARAYQFRCQLLTDSIDHDVVVEKLRVVVDVPDRREDWVATSSASADIAETIPNGRYWAAPSVGYKIKGAVAGDHVDEVSVTATTVTLSVRDSGNARVVRDVEIQTAGWGRGTS